MGASRLLGIAELAEAQVQAFQTVNDGVDALEKASNRILHIDVIGLAEYILNEHDFTRYQVFILDNATTDLELKVPEFVNTESPNRVISVINKGIFNVTVLTVAGTGTDTVVMTAGAAKQLYIEGVEVNEITSGGTGAAVGATAMTIALYIPGVPNNGDEVLRYTFTGIVDFAINFGGSQGGTGVNPTSSAVFSILKNGGVIGTVTIDTAGTYTFSTGTPIQYNPGDQMIITAPSPQDATLANISLTLKGLRS